MASYQELFDVSSNTALLNRITAAVAIQAEAVRVENPATTNHANRLIWAKEAFSDPAGMAKRMMWAILAQNVAFSQAQILAANDAAVLTAVANAVDVFATGATAPAS